MTVGACASSLTYHDNLTHHDDLQVEWRDISYSVEVGKGASRKTKQILCGLSGIAEPGHVVAIMGPTGSGKTRCVNESCFISSSSYSRERLAPHGNSQDMNASNIACLKI
jgi:ABC-type lipoprotein export system ATPase subunit